MLESSQGYIMEVKGKNTKGLVPFLRGVFINKVDENGIYINEIEGFFNEN